jgi:bifunctional DNA-binding transcriptional regulator/antitoxin component of YhaV-PrlF toxin-antitoxin module
MVAAEIEVAFVKVQPRARGNYMVTVPSEAVKMLGIKDNERTKVYVDKDKKRIIFELMKS